MKFSYQWLQEYVSEKLPKPEKLAELFAAHAFEVERVEQKGNDWIFDLDILPNRMADAASHFGVAREIGAILKVKSSARGGSASGGKNEKGKTTHSISSGQANKKLKKRYRITALQPYGAVTGVREDPARKIQDAFEVRVGDPKLCSRYSARVVFDVRVGPSPEWLKERLVTVGVGSINNIVDAANYVMLALGQPLHAFDLDKIKSVNPKSQNPNSKWFDKLTIPSPIEGQIPNPKFQIPKRNIIVRRAKQGEKIETLDGEKRKLTPSILVIADMRQPLAIAGVKGGKAAEITNETRTVVLEAANFDALAIRRASRLLGVQSDAARRFESGIDQNLTALALDACAALIMQCAGGIAAQGVIDVWPRRQPRRTIGLDPSAPAATLGVPVSAQDARAVLEALGCIVKVSTSGSFWQVVPPSFRFDLLRSEDLVEEVGRLLGYERITPVMPALPLLEGSRPQVSFYAERARDVLKGFGYLETMTYAMASRALLKKTGFDQRAAAFLENPPSAEFECLVPSILPRLLEQCAENAKYQARVELFELGKRFIPKETGVEERLSLAVAVYAKDAQTRDADFFSVKGALAELARGFGLADITFEDARVMPQASMQRFWHPRRIAAIKLHGEEIGFLGEAHPAVLSAFVPRGHAVMADMDFEKLATAAIEEHEYREPPRYPEVKRDIALLVERNTFADLVASELSAAAGSLLRDIDLFDYYEGEGIPEGKKNLAFHLYFQAREKTLTAKEVDGAMKAVYQRAEEMGWEVR